MHALANSGSDIAGYTDIYLVLKKAKSRIRKNPLKEVEVDLNPRRNNGHLETFWNNIINIAVVISALVL